MRSPSGSWHNNHLQRDTPGGVSLLISPRKGDPRGRPYPTMNGGGRPQADRPSLFGWVINFRAAFGGHPHQSKIGSEEPIFDSFSLEGEAFGGNSYQLREYEPRWITDKASPLGETPQGGLSCPFGAIHLQLSAPGSSEPGAD